MPLSPKTKLVTVFEFGYLAPVEVADSRCKTISQAGFDHLESECLRQSKSNEASFLRLRSLRGERVLQVTNYVGVLSMPTGEQVEILPKLGKTQRQDGERYAREVLLNMLHHLRSFRHIASSDAQIATRKMTLLEIFIGQFLQSVNLLVKRGLSSDYVRREDNVMFLKGKLQPAKQLKHNLVQRHRFHVEFDEYQRDQPVNRLIRLALDKVLGYSRLNSNQKLCRELLFAFADIEPSKQVKQDLAAVSLGRGMRHYRASFDWAKLIIQGVSPLSMAGEKEAISLLFPMEAVFEAFVADSLQQQVSPRFELSLQCQSTSLATYHSEGSYKESWFRLRPDLMIKQGQQPTCVMDTKWKLIDSADRQNKFGLSQADFYQMFAYGHKYLGGQGDLLLIYPRSDSFNTPLASPFVFDEETDTSLKLWIVPFDISPTCPDSKRMCLPESYPAPWLPRLQVATA